MVTSAERRGAIARKLHFIDGWTPTRIRDYFEEQGIGDFKVRTISGYFDDESAEETKRLVREQHADEDLRIARSLQRKHDRALRDERRATVDERITAFRPVTAFNEGRLSVQKPDWEVIDHNDHRAPAWAIERDVVVEFKPSQWIDVHPGEEYYVSDPAGNPTYEEVTVGVERDQPDLEMRRRLRKDQRESLDKKAKRLGIDDDSIDVNLGGSVDVDHTVPDDVVEAIISTSADRLDSNAQPDGSPSDGSDAENEGEHQHE